MLMDVTELIIKKLNNNLPDEKEQDYKEWLEESYMNESTVRRLEILKERGDDFSEITNVNVASAWKEIQSKLKKNNTNNNK